MSKIRRSLTRVLTAREDKIVQVTRAAPRQVRMFNTETRVEFSDNPADGNTEMELVTADRPGLLSKIGEIFKEQAIDITAAKIMTIGERAEDVFYIEHADGSPLGTDAQKALRAEVIARLNEKNAGTY